MGRRKIDISRLSAMVTRPGVDPRMWINIGVVRSRGFDKKHGIFIDVQIIPTLETVTVYLGAPYAANKAGFYFPVKIDDVVMVAIPNGDAGIAPVLMCRFWRASDPPSEDFQSEDDEEEPTDNTVLRVGENEKFIIRTSGDMGDIDIQVEGDGEVNVEAKGAGDVRLRQTGSGKVFIYAEGAKVYLGGEDGTQPVALGTAVKNHLDNQKTWMDNHTHGAGLYIAPPMGGSVTGVSGGPVGASPSVPDVESDTTEVKP